jgi:putative transcriptional regulator
MTGRDSKGSILGHDVEDSAPTEADSSLTNHLLIAMPSLSDPNFSQTVALVCEHTDKGALGIVLNKPLPMKLSDVLSQMKLEPSNETIGELPVLRGGPVNTDRGFVLHRPGGKWDHTHKVSDAIQVTTSRDVLAAMARGEGPLDAFIALGYAGWESGQLEREMGIDVERLSLVAGHA